MFGKSTITEQVHARVLSRCTGLSCPKTSGFWLAVESTFVLNSTAAYRKLIDDLNALIAQDNPLLSFSGVQKGESESLFFT